MKQIPRRVGPAICSQGTYTTYLSFHFLWGLISGGQYKLQTVGNNSSQIHWHQSQSVLRSQSALLLIERPQKTSNDLYKKKISYFLFKRDYFRRTKKYKYQNNENVIHIGNSWVYENYEVLFKWYMYNCIYLCNSSLILLTNFI